MTGSRRVRVVNQPEVTGTLIVTNSGTFAVQAAAAQSGVWTVQPGGTQNSVPWRVTAGWSSGRAGVYANGSLSTTATTADQVITGSSYTVTAGKTFYLQGLHLTARNAATPGAHAYFGTLSLESPATTKLLTFEVSADTDQGIVTLGFPEPIPFAAGTVVRLVCTPAAATNFAWRTNMWGYEV